MDSMFVERCFELNGGTLATKFQQPLPQATGEYRCKGIIQWPDGDEDLEARGEDGVQALMLALKLAHHKFLQTDAYREGRLTLWTQRDLDLLPDWGNGPLYGDPRLWKPRETDSISTDG